MIDAKIHQVLNDNAGIIIEFSDQNGRYKDDPNHFIVVRDKTDLLKRLYFKNRVYICDTLISFLNQRKHALPEYSTKIEMLIGYVQRSRNHTYPALCDFVHFQSKHLKELAPSEKSPFYNHYKNNIEPILIECENIHTGKAKVHYC